MNGKLHEGDTIVLAGIEGPIVTQVRALLMPQPLKELRVKNQYVTHKEIIGAQGVKIAAKELEKALAGISLYVAQQPDEIEYFKVSLVSLTNLKTWHFLNFRILCVMLGKQCFLYRSLLKTRFLSFQAT